VHDLGGKEGPLYSVVPPSNDSGTRDWSSKLSFFQMTVIQEGPLYSAVPPSNDSGTRDWSSKLSFFQMTMTQEGRANIVQFLIHNTVTQEVHL
jgi:hypothetical protein